MATALESIAESLFKLANPPIKVTPQTIIPDAPAVSHGEVYRRWE